MKNVICFLLILSFSYNLSAQTEIPSLVLDAFTEKEPNVKNPFWELREGAYVAMFADEDGLQKIFFNDNGNWLETRTRLAKNELPVGVVNFIDTHYSAADITYMGIVNSNSGTTYRVESELPNTVVIKLLNKGGKLLEEKRIEWNDVYPVDISQVTIPLLEIDFIRPVKR